MVSAYQACVRTKMNPLREYRLNVLCETRKDAYHSSVGVGQRDCIRRRLDLGLHGLQHRHLGAQPLDPFNQSTGAHLSRIIIKTFGEQHGLPTICTMSKANSLAPKAPHRASARRREWNAPVKRQTSSGRLSASKQGHRRDPCRANDADRQAICRWLRRSRRTPAKHGGPHAASFASSLASDTRIA